MACAEPRPAFDGPGLRLPVKRVTAGETTRNNYERRPYPGTERRAQIEKGGTLPAVKWILALGRPGLPPPQRILVAGCGSGAEAFFLRRQFPSAEIVAVDFSPRSIALARRLQRSAGFTRPIQFEVADLMDLQLPNQTGGGFDLITCHGVLSYIPQPEIALAHLGACLRPDGTLYLGVNGAAHPANRLRPWLESFGLSVQELPNERRLRKLLGVWDVLNDDAQGELATMPATYLAGDVCGSHFNNWPIEQWRKAAHQTGWEIAGLGILPPALSLLLATDQHHLLYPATLGALAEILDHARPAGFHRLVLRRSAAGSLDALNPTATDAPLVWTGLYSVRFRSGDASSRVRAAFRSMVLDLPFESTLGIADAQILRRLAASGSLPAADFARWRRRKTIRPLLWLWSHLGVIAVGNPSPPAKAPGPFKTE